MPILGTKHKQPEGPVAVLSGCLRLFVPLIFAKQAMLLS